MERISNPNGRIVPFPKKQRSLPPSTLFPSSPSPPQPPPPPPLPSDMVKERVITVEYLEPSMSRELVGKFPDNSAFDFEYSQSSIWSPLLPRSHHAPAPLLCLQARKKLLSGSPVTFRKVKAKFSKKKKKKRSAIGKNLEFTPIPSPKLGWKRALRAAAKRFKIRGKSPLQMVLPTL